MVVTVLPPVAICVCGHLKRVHFGDGPCLGAHRNKDGKELDATVCPCTEYEEQGDPAR